VNVNVETLAPCKKQLRVEIDPAAVDAAFESITKEFQKEARLPGFRPGKAPKEMILRKYEKDIEDEVKRKLISETYRKAVDDQKLDVVGSPSIEELEFGRGKKLEFLATIETAPDFELPEYKGLPVKLEARSTTDDDVAKAIELLRKQRVTFNTVERGATETDMTVVNYKATCEGKPLTDLAPTAKGLTEKSGFWVEMTPGKFIPGFAEQLMGAKAGDRRTVTVEFPADFVAAQLAGKPGIYEVEVVEIKEPVLPETNDEFAQSFGAESFAKLQDGVRRDLENELKYTKEKATRNQLIRTLLERVQFDLPEAPVAAETRNVVYDIVSENQKRGVSRDIIEKQKEEIYSAAAQGARERVKIAFLLQKIAEKENIGVSQEELSRRIQTLATMYQIPPDKFVKDLQKRNGLVEIYDQVMNDKVLKFLQEHAQVEEVQPATPEPAPAAPAS